MNQKRCLGYNKNADGDLDSQRNRRKGQADCGKTP